MVFHGNRTGGRDNTSYSKLKELIIFPGSKQEYEEFRGYAVQIVDTKSPMKAFYFDNGGYVPNDMDWMLGEIEAIVNASISEERLTFGLPVKRK